MTNLLTPMHELDRETQVRVAAFFFVRGGAPLSAWLHLEVKVLLRNQVKLEEFIDELRGKEKEDPNAWMKEYMKQHEAGSSKP